MSLPPHDRRTDPEKGEVVTFMNEKKTVTVASLPLPVYLLVLVLTLLCVALDCVPPNLVGAFLLLMVLGEGLNKLGNTIPVAKTYLGGSVFCIFGGALLACSGWLPRSAAELMNSFVNEQGFLIFYISALICGSLFSIDRDLLLKGAVRLVPVGLLAIFSGILVCGVMGLAGGDGFVDSILYIAVPMTAGTVPLSQTFSQVLGVDAGEVLTRMAPATVLGNCLAIIFAGLLNDLGRRRPQLTGNGQLVNDGRPPRKADHGQPTLSSMMTGLLVSLSFYAAGELCRRFVPIVPVYAWMVVLIILIKVLRLMPARLENAACHWGDFAIKAWTAAALFGIGVTLIDLKTISHNMSLYYFLTVLAVEVVITVVAAWAGKLVGFYPLESAVCGMCSTNMGGSGNVAVLSGAHRMELLPFAQIITRGCGALMLTVGGILVHLVA